MHADNKQKIIVHFVMPNMSKQCDTFNNATKNTYCSYCCFALELMADEKEQYIMCEANNKMFAWKYILH